MLEICYTLDGKTIYARWEEQGDEERVLLWKYGQFEVRSNAAHTPAHPTIRLPIYTHIEKQMGRAKP